MPWTLRLLHRQCRDYGLKLLLKSSRPCQNITHVKRCALLRIKTVNSDLKVDTMFTTRQKLPAHAATLCNPLDSSTHLDQDLRRRRTRLHSAPRLPFPPAFKPICKLSNVY